MKIIISNSAIKSIKICSLLVGSLFLQEAYASPLVACYGYMMHSCPEPVDKIIPDPQRRFSWSQSEKVVGSKNMYHLFAGDVFLSSENNIQKLPVGQSVSNVEYKLDGKKLGISDYLKNQNITGLLVIKNGKIVLEHYGDSVNETTLWASRSVAKSIVSVLIGVAIKDHAIESVDTLITKYIPELESTAWEGVTLHQLMQHTSGIQWSEDLSDPNSDVSKMILCETAKDPYSCILSLVSGLARNPGVKPGERWSINTGGAWLVGLVLERATGMTIAKYLEKKVWQPAGMERDGVWYALKPGKVDMGGYGFNATLRDWGRFGLLVANNGVLSNGEHVLPGDWIKRSTDWTKADGSVKPWAPKGQHGYQWWYMGFAPGDEASYAPTSSFNSDESFWAYGIFGQAIAINQKENLIMVQWSTWGHAEGPDVLYSEQGVFFNSLIQALH